MYKGTLIQDLVVMVERAKVRAELKAEQQRIVEEQELHAIFTMQIPITDGDKIFMGAA